MSFDALTIGGILAAILAGGFFIALVSRNDMGINGRGTVAEADNGR